MPEENAGVQTVTKYFVYTATFRMSCKVQDTKKEANGLEIDDSTRFRATGNSMVAKFVGN